MNRKLSAYLILFSLTFGTVLTTFGIVHECPINKPTQNPNDSWQLTGHNSGSDSRLIEKTESKADGEEGWIHRYTVSRNLVDVDPFCSDIKEVVFVCDANGKIENIHILLEVLRTSDFATRINNPRWVEVLRESVMMLLVVGGELQWQDSPVEACVITSVLPRCNFQVGIVGSGDKQTVDLGSFSKTQSLEAQQIGTGVFCVKVPVALSGASYIWICGDANNPDGAVLTTGFPMDQFGKEFKSIDGWAKVVRVTDDDLEPKQARVNQLLTTITPVVNACPQDVVNEEEYRHEDWIWSIRVGDDFESLSEIGVLKMSSLNLSRDAFHDWTEKTFTFIPQGKGSTQMGALLQFFPEKLICRRNDKKEVSHIKAHYHSLNQSMLSSPNLNILTQYFIGLLLSTGALDSVPSRDNVIPGRFPIGIQKTSFSKDGVIDFFVADKNEKMFSCIPADVGLLQDSNLSIRWMHTLALNNKFRQVFGGHLQGRSGGSAVKMFFVHAWIGHTASSIWRYPPVGSYRIERSTDEWKTKESSQQIWCVRTKPQSDYFDCLLDHERDLMYREMSEKKREPKTIADITLMSRFSQLLEELSVEESGRVFNSLLAINRAKKHWAQSTGAEPNQNVTWSDIAPFLECARENLPHPLGGEYVLGENLLSAPDYRLKGKRGAQPKNCP